MTDDSQPTEAFPAEPEYEEDGYRIPTARWAVPAGLVIVVVALVAIALLRGPTHFDPTTAEGAVQDYLLAINEARWEDAFAVLDPESFPNCEPQDIFAGGNVQPFSAVHDGTDQQAGSTLVNVRLRFGDQGGIGGGWESWEQFVLIERDGFWYITAEPWPYFRWSCEEF